MRHRIAIGGIHIESSTFSPHRSGAADFTVVRGDELLARYDDLPRHVDWLPLVHARALPGGAVERNFYASVKAELLERLRAALPLDGVFLDIHGAMTVVGLTDAEGDLATAVRGVVGPGALLSASMDPHGNMSRELVTALDLATSHRLSPHEDAPLTRRRAVANLVACLDRGVRPVKAWVRVPVLLPGERASTRDEPARSIYGGLPALATGRATAIWASVVDPSAVAECARAGKGATVELRVGGAFGSRPGAQVALHGEVRTLSLGDPIGGDIAVVASGGVRAVLTSRRKPFHFIHDFTRLGLDPATHDLTVVKVGYLVPD